MTILTRPIVAVGCARASSAWLWPARANRRLSPFARSPTVKELMMAMIEPAADLYWDAVGTVDDSTGSKSDARTSPEEWATVRRQRDDHRGVGQSLDDGRPGPDRDQWMMLARAMIDAGKQAVAAAAAQDTAAVLPRRRGVRELHPVPYPVRDSTTTATRRKVARDRARVSPMAGRDPSRASRCASRCTSGRSSSPRTC